MPLPMVRRSRNLMVAVAPLALAALAAARGRALGSLSAPAPAHGTGNDVVLIRALVGRAEATALAGLAALAAQQRATDNAADKLAARALGRAAPPAPLPAAVVPVVAPPAPASVVVVVAVVPIVAVPVATSAGHELHQHLVKCTHCWKARCDKCGCRQASQPTLLPPQCVVRISRRGVHAGLEAVSRDPAPRSASPPARVGHRQAARPTLGHQGLASEDLQCTSPLAGLSELAYVDAPRTKGAVFTCRLRSIPSGAVHLQAASTSRDCVVEQVSDGAWCGKSVRWGGC